MQSSHEATSTILVPLTLDSFDCLYTVVSFLYSNEVMNIRRVSQLWNSVCSHNSFWSVFYENDLGELLEQQKELEDDFYLKQYVKYINWLPRVIGFENTERYKLTMSAGTFLVGIDKTYILPGKDINVQLHTLSVILSVLNSNGYIPKLYHSVRLGDSKHDISIRLSKFCYAFIFGTIENQFIEKLYPFSIESDEGDDNPAVGADVVGAFVPFVYYMELLKDGCGETTVEQVMNKFGSTSGDAVVSEGPMYVSKDIFGENEQDIESIKIWSTHEDGWAPGFLNASFTVCSIISRINE
jgi:hypothetical protein